MTVSSLALIQLLSRDTSCELFTIYAVSALPLEGSQYRLQEEVDIPVTKLSSLASFRQHHNDYHDGDDRHHVNVHDFHASTPFSVHFIFLDGSPDLQSARDKLEVPFCPSVVNW